MQAISIIYDFIVCHFQLLFCGCLVTGAINCVSIALASFFTVQAREDASALIPCLYGSYASEYVCTSMHSAHMVSMLVSAR